MRYAHTSMSITAINSGSITTIAFSTQGLLLRYTTAFLGRGVEAEDLFQIGTIGLMKAIDKFDLSYQVKFSTYAVPLISGEIKRFLRDDGIIKVSRIIKMQAVSINKFIEDYNRKTGETPTVEQISKA